MNVWKNILYEIKIEGMPGDDINQCIRQGIVFCLEKNVNATMELNQDLYNIDVFNIIDSTKVKK